LNRFWALTAVWLSASCIASLALGATVRNQLEIGQGFWLVDTQIFVRHDQNLNLPLPFAVLVAGVSAAALAALALAIARAAPESPSILLAVAGIGIGGALANAIEAAANRSVTDFLAIRGSGIFSAGDIAYFVCGALLPVALDRAIRARCSTTVRVGVGLAALAAVGLAALSRGHWPLMIGVLVVAISIGGIVLLRQSLATRLALAPPHSSR
jgi:hypothetical protein